MQNKVFNPSESSRAAMASLAKKTATGKTVFRLHQSSIAVIQTLSSGKVTMKDTIDIMAKLVNAQDRDGKLSISEITGERERKCFTISENARKIFNDLARKYKVSRDIIVENAILALCSKIQEMELTTEKKIEYAKILIDMVQRMLKIYDEPEAVKAREKLIECNDKDFGVYDDFQSCRDLLGYIDQIYDLPYKLDKYIEIKEEEKCNKNYGRKK